jgi:hypothetical protein
MSSENPAKPEAIRLNRIFTEGSSRHVGARYGIEIEVEYAKDVLDLTAYERATSRLLKNWRSEEDGSLRNQGTELISRPLQPEALTEAISDAYDWINKAGKAPSSRCGLHVHVNMGGHDAERFSDIVATYILAEPYLFGVVGAEREQNTYCIPWYLDLAQYRMAQGLVQSLYAGQPLRKRDIIESGTMCKYSALNVLPLFKYHTIEFRHAAAYRTAAETLNWVRIVEAVTEKAPYIMSRPDPRAALLGTIEPYMSPTTLAFADERYTEYDIFSRMLEFRRKAQPCTYKAKSWGLPTCLEAAEKGALREGFTAKKGAARPAAPRFDPGEEHRRDRTPLTRPAGLRRTPPRPARGASPRTTIAYPSFLAQAQDQALSQILAGAARSTGLPPQPADTLDWQVAAEPAMDYYDDDQGN